MNTYDMVLYWQNKYLVMEKEVRKAQKGIVRLKRREKYLLECIDKYNMASDSMIGYLKSDNEKLMATEMSMEYLKNLIKNTRAIDMGNEYWVRTEDWEKISNL